MRPLQEQIASSFSTLSVDWPGFGDLPRPSVAWEAGAYRAFLRHLLEKVYPQPYATIAAGHAAGFLLSQAAAHPASVGHLNSGRTHMAWPLANDAWPTPHGPRQDRQDRRVAGDRANALPPQCQ